MWVPELSCQVDQILMDLSPNQFIEIRAAQRKTKVIHFDSTNWSTHLILLIELILNDH